MSEATLEYRSAEGVRQQRLIGGIMLGMTATFLLAGVPALYSGGAIDITTINQLGRFLALAIVALGADLVWGYAGILSLCQAMFFVFGGYAIGMHMALHGPLDGEGIPRCLFVVSSDVSGFSLPWFWQPFRTLPLAVMLGMFIPGLFAFLFGYFTFRSRVRGVYFSIITQAITLAAMNVFSINNIRLCGTNGLTNFVTLAGFDLQSSRVRLGLYCLTVLVLIAVYLICVGIVRSRLGRLLIAVRDSESRLRFAGFQPVTFKVFVFVFAAAIAGIGGMLYTPQNGIITPAKLNPGESIAVIAFVAVGGRGTLSGAVIGAIVVSYLQSLLSSGFFYAWLPMFLKIQPGVAQTGVMGGVKRFLQILLGADGWLFVFGALFILVTLLFPEGIVGGWRRLLSGRRSETRAAIEADIASASAEEGAQPSVSLSKITENHV